MREFDHPNILCLIGICFDDVIDDEGQGGQGQPMVVTPYMQHGDLLNYIRDDDNVSVGSVRRVVEYMNTACLS